MQSVESGSNTSAGTPTGTARSSVLGITGSGLTFAVMVLVLLVALIFAANQNDVIGWLLVAISAGWLVLAILVVLGVRRGAQSVDRRMKNLTASLAPRSQSWETADPAAPSASAGGPATPAADPMRDTKLDHQFKIVQVQTRVITEELAKGDEADREMVDRALETITITSSNARDMLKEDDAGPGPERATGTSRGGGQPKGQHGRPDAQGPISGEVIN